MEGKVLEKVFVGKSRASCWTAYEAFKESIIGFKFVLLDREWSTYPAEWMNDPDCKFAIKLIILYRLT